MIKKYLLGLSLVCLTLFGVSFGDSTVNYEQLIPISPTEKYLSHVSSAYDIGALPKGRFLTNYAGYGRKLFGLDSKTFIFWNDGRLYLYDTKYIGQGYFNKYRICYGYSSSTGLYDCTDYDNFGGYFSSDIFPDFVSRLSSGDYVYYNYTRNTYSMGGGFTVSYNNIEFCLMSSNSSLGYVCFAGTNCSYDSQCSRYNYAPLGTSLGLGDVSVGTISDSYLGESPGFIPGQIENGGSSSVSSSVELTGDVYYMSCNYNKALAYYRNRGYSDNLCYAGISFTGVDNNYWGVINPGQGINLLDLRFYFGDYRPGGFINTGHTYTLAQFVDTWRNQYILYRENPGYNGFDDVPVAVRTWGNMVNNYGKNIDNRTLIDYCTIIYNIENGYSINTEYDGVNSKNICSVSNIIDNINGGGIYDNGNGGSITSSGTVLGSDLGGLIGGNEGFGNGNYEEKSYIDGSSFINDTINELKSNYRMPNKSDFGLGILPGYIIIAFCGLLLFRFISH